MSGPFLTATRPEKSGFGLPYAPGLDGLRAIAVLAVLLYHADLGWIRGGFLGVEVFFVISGFLITSLLLAEYRKTGGVDLVGFWFGRARRLLPAVFFMMAVTATYAVVFLPEEVAGLRSDILAAAGYVTNWYLVFENESYFEAVGRPSLLRHLWSLAVEEQFYLLWPVAVAVGLRLFRRGGVMTLAVLGAAASAGLMFYLYDPGLDPSRVYYGTDTRASGLLVGAALAFFCVPGRGFSNPNGNRGKFAAAGRLRRRFGWTGPAFLDAVGVGALVVLGWFFLNVGEAEPFLYRGGFVVVALVTALLIAAVVHPHAHLGIIGLGPMRWLGLRSYGIYLWHWPVFMVTRPDLDVPAGVLGGWQLFAARMLATLVLADISYRFVETPIRRGALGRALKDLARARGRRKGRLGLQWSAAAVFCTALFAVLGANLVSAKPPETPEYLSRESIRTDLAPVSIRPEKPPAEPVADNPEPEQPPGEAASEPVEEASPAPGPITAVGDSVMLGASEVLAERLPEMEITDASVGMQVADAISILQTRRDAGQLGNTVVLHLGTNGTFTDKEFREIMSILGGVERVYFINVEAPRSWEPTNNEVIESGVEEHDNATLIDWHAASDPNPEYFYGDGIHPAPQGAEVYADLISSSLGL
ncbi:acyltransferase family protein [Rubrobacter indicoceani]|uniref:acyltransferase family protein n=1 Tax=Rubrobacter indicoceani TaxID=2051957 RepID=UPI000E5AB7E1|nr:acyltransferase family protein [Rubrobacter indicoceani]